MEGEVLNISPIVVWVIALSQLLTFGLTVWNLMASGSRANARRLDEHGARLQGHGDRLAQLEMGQKTGPTMEALHDIDNRMVGLQGAIEVLTQRLRPLEAIGERLMEAHFSQGPR